MPQLSFRSDLQRLIAGERCDPRIPQALFLVPVTLELVLRLITPGRSLDPMLVNGLALVGLTTLATVAMATGMLPRRWTIALPMLDIAALGVMVASPNSLAAGVAITSPSIWLGLQYGRRGVQLAFLTTLLTISSPTLFREGWHAQPLSKAVQLLVMSLLCSLLVHMTAKLWAEHRAMLTETSRRLESAMAESRHQRSLNDALVNSVNIGLVMLGADGHYRSMNRRHRDFMAKAFPDGHAGRAGQLGEVYAEDGVTLLTRQQMPSYRAMQGEEFTDMVMWVGADPATRQALTVTARSVVDPHGDLEGVVLSYQDVTDVVIASRMKDEFVARVSHELRTPLTSIIGYTDLLSEDVEDMPTEAHGYLATVERNAHRLLRLVDDLLQTAEQSSGVTLDLAPLDLNALVEQAAEAARTRAREHGLTFALEADRVPTVLADADRLGQVLDNLLSNAVKYTPAGGGITLRLLSEADQVVVRVGDSGIGISTQDREQVFSKFFRSRQAEEMAIPGVGLGLAITQAIVAGHAGTISVAPNPGGGTLFEVRLPLDGRASLPTGPPPTPLQLVTSTPPGREAQPA